jgi:hypothetical protein
VAVMPLEAQKKDETASKSSMKLDKEGIWIQDIYISLYHH